ncbi:hypothetical protein [Aliarcobacter butzleri]|uniref:hypothetical protein n=1 Tax=Aliarcobacter butzleri TaxID=28197 RepID=UPI00125FCA61|nr:hypothetical protein [Aliarcobacter butzleri]MCG3650990.1 hypothetical protein [Aliarcobacter butzleri]MCG3680180.1 hypothetical protein [Aliarcobacter butzleri]
MTKYIIYSKNLSNGFEEEILKEKYDELNKSKKILSEVFAKEKIYNIILMNYYEFEKELFEINLRDEVFQSDYADFSEYLSRIEQRILNLLSSVTLYLDSFKDDLKDKYVEELKNEYQQIFKIINETLENEQQIKLMKYLRNQIQHNGLLVTNFSFDGKNLSDDLREQTLQFGIDKNTIKARGFKIDDFKDFDEKIDLKRIIRVYTDFISVVHQKFRELTNEKTTNARNEFENIFNQYLQYKYLCVAQKINNEIVNEIQILLYWDDIRLEMIKKNRVPTAFKRHSINTK